MLSPTTPLRRFGFLPSRTSTSSPSPSPSTIKPIYSAFLRVTRPGPLTSIHQSRSILHHLESHFGPINYFLERRHLPSSPPSDTYIITIFSSRTSYEKALASSPLIIPTQTSSPAIQVEVSPTLKYNHPSAVTFNPFHGPYDIHRSNTTYQTLRALGAPKPGIADFQIKGREVFFARRREMLLRRTEIIPGVELGGRWRGGPTGFAVAMGEHGDRMGKGGLMGLWREKMREVEAKKLIRGKDGGDGHGREGSGTGSA